MRFWDLTKALGSSHKQALDVKIVKYLKKTKCLLTLGPLENARCCKCVQMNASLSLTPSKTRIYFILWVSAPLGFRWLRLCLRLLITVSIYLSNRQQPLALLKWHSQTSRPMPHHHVLLFSPAAVGSFLKSALSHHLPVSWLCWVVTVCTHHPARICLRLQNANGKHWSASTRVTDG